MAKEVMTEEKFVDIVKDNMKKVYKKDYLKWLNGYFSDAGKDKEKAFIEVIKQYCPDTKEHWENEKYVKSMLNDCCGDFLCGMAM